MSKEKKRIFFGVGTALVTPFADGGVDYKSLGRLIEHQIECGADALVVCGTTGESCTLSDTEHRRVLDFALSKAGGRVPMIAGTGSNDTAHAVETSVYASSLGYDGLLVVTPYYNKATQRGLCESFLRIAEASKSPLILYNVPSRTSCNITLDTYRTLAEHENIVAVKEASGNISSIAELICECGDKIDVYSGNDDQTLPILSVGGVGVISVVSNIIPRQMSELCKRWFDGDVGGCLGLYKRFLPLMNAMFSQVNPIPVKTALSLMGICREEFRLPLCPMSDTEKQSLARVLDRYGVI